MKIIKPANNSRTAILKGVSTLDVRNMRIVLLLLVITVFGNSIYAGHSILDRVDPSFNPQIQTHSFGWKWVNQVQALPDGKVLALGGFNTYNGVPVGKLVRLNADGSLDPTFNNQTVTAAETADLAAKIIIQPDGKIVLKCTGLVAGGQGPKRLLRLNADGTFDPTFNFTQTSFIGDIAMDSLGRLMLTGSFTTPQGTRLVIRLNNDGSLDNSFNFTPPAAASLLGMAVQGNRTLVATNVKSVRQLYRLNEDGSTDGSFAPFTGIQALLAVQPDNKILYRNGNNLLRLNENGGTDGTFQTIAFPQTGQQTIKLTNDGKIVMAAMGFFSSATFSRYLSNGAADPSFNQYTQQWPASFTIGSDDSMVLGDSNNMGGSSGLINNFVRLTSAGTPDPAFNPGGIGFQNMLPGVIEAIETYPDGKVLLAGKFDQINNVLRYRIARLNADTTVDTTFQINTTSGNGNYFSMIWDIYQIRVQADGKMVVSGFFDYVLNGVTKKNLVRLNSDGSIDAAFNLTHPIPDYSQILLGGQNRFAAYSDGKLMVGTSKSGTAEIAGPVKLTAGGVRDTSFIPTLNGTSTSLYFDDVAIQPDGKIIASGSYEANNNPPTGMKSFIARYNTDGTIDTAFSYAEEPGRLRSRLVLLPNGKILISKSVHPTGGSARIQRLNSDGTADTSFSSVLLSDNTAIINALLVLPNGKIFVGGKFTITVNGQPAKNLLQLGVNGNFEPTTYNLNEEVLCLAADSDGRVLVGGGFTVIGANGSGATRSYVARLTDSRTPFDFDGDGKSDVSLFRPSEGTWYLSQSQNGFSAQNFGLKGDVITPGDFDGDGKTDLAIWRPGTGTWWYKSTINGGFYAVVWGQAGDIPLAEDFNGDGKADFVFYRPSNSTWYRLGSNGQYAPIAFGAAGDIPLVADMDGDGKADPTIYRPSTGTWWYASSVNGLFYAIQWGGANDIPVPGDYDGDGKADPAYFRVSDGAWFIDLAIYRPSNGMWFALRSTSGFFSQQFGLLGDEAVPNAFIP
jgi:uncharacterized delta-60 repeat protein